MTPPPPTGTPPPMTGEENERLKLHRIAEVRLEHPVPVREQRRIERRHDLGIQLLVACVTLGFLYVTFRETRRTANAAVQAANAADASLAAAMANTQRE